MSASPIQTKTNPPQPAFSGDAAAKQSRLLQLFAELDSVIVALSGGADSAYLAWAANQSLGGRAVCVTAISPSFSAHDRGQVENFVRSTAIRHSYVETDELADPRYAANSPDRCYFCKDELFRTLEKVATQHGVRAIAYGINADDTTDFRPGHRAATEHRILAPLLECGLTKAEIRELSRIAGLSTWDRPASACLASRIPHGTTVTRENLSQVERGESILRELGFRQFRVRHHEELARIEIAPEELPNALQVKVAAELAARFKQIGYRYVTLDLEGYRQGSLNPIAKESAAGSQNSVPPSFPILT